MLLSPRARRIVRGILLGFLGLLLALGLALAWLTQTNSGRRVLITQIAEFLSGSLFSGTISAEELSGPIFGRLSLHGVTLTDEDGVVAASIETLNVRFTVIELLSGRLLINRLTAEGATVNGRIRRDGSLNLAGLLTPSDPNKPPAEKVFAVTMQHIALSGVDFKIVDERTNELVVRFGQPELRGTFNLQSDGAIYAGVSTLSSPIEFGIAPGREFTVTIDQLGLEMNEKSIHFAADQLTVGETGLFGFDGTIERSSDPEKPFEFLFASIPRLYFAPSEVEVFVPGLPLTTALMVDATLAGPPESVELNAALIGNEQAAALTLALDLTGEDAGINGLFAVENFQPELWLDMPGVTGDVTANIQFNVQGLTPHRLKADALITIEPSTLLGYRIDASSLAFGYQDRVAYLSDLSLAAGSVRVTGEAAYGLNGEVSANLDIDAPDLSDLKDRSPMAPDIRGSLQATLFVEGTLPLATMTPEMTASLPAIWETFIPNLDIEGRVRGQGVRLPGLSIGTLNVDLRSSIANRGAAGLTGKVTALQLGETVVDDVNLNARATHDTIALDGVVRAFGSELVVDAAGAWSLTGVDLQIDQLALTHQELAFALAYPARVTATMDETGALTQATVDRFYVTGEGIELRVGRLVYAERGAIQGDLWLTVEDVRPLLEAVGLEDLDADGALNLSGYVQGTLSAPEYLVTLSADRLKAMGIGPIGGDLRVEQLRTHMTVDGALCFDEREGGDRGERDLDNGCQGRDLLILAEDLHLPFVPGFGPVGPKLDDEGVLQGVAVIGPLDIERLATGIPALQAFEPRGEVGVWMGLNGTVQEPDVAMTASVRDVYVKLDDGSASGVVVGPISTDGLFSISDSGEGITNLQYGLGRDGLRLDGETWLTARGDLRSPLRTFLLGEINAQELLADTWGEVISVEIRERSFADIPGRFLPTSIAKRGRFYLRADLTRENSFTGAKINAFVNELIYDDIGPVNVMLSAISSADTQARVLVDTVDEGGESYPMQLDLDAVLDVSLGELLSRGILPEDRLDARLIIPSTKIDAFPVGVLRAQQMLVGFVDEELATPSVEGYIDIYHTLEDLRLRGRIKLDDLITATGARTEAGIELLYGPSSEMGFGGGSVNRLQASVSVCGPDNLCAMELRAAALPNLRTGVFLFGSEREQKAASDRLMQTPYAVTLYADDAPLAALAPAWLLTSLATGVDGRLFADLRVDGTLASVPSVAGSLRISDMQGEIIPLARRIEELDLTLEAAGDRLLIHDLYINDGRGTVLGSGDISLVRGLPERAALVFDFKSFLLADASGMGAYLTAQVPVDATITSSAIDVDVRIGDADIYVPDSIMSGATAGPVDMPQEIVLVPGEYALRDFMLYSERLARAPEGQEGESTSAIPIRVKVKNTGEIRVTQRFADVRLDLDLTLRMDSAGITTAGSVDVTSGHAQVFGKRFDVTMGRVVFDGGGDGPFDPRVRLTASHRLPRKTAALLDTPAGQYATVSVVMDTRISDLTVELTSDPLMSESDILNVLLTGKPIDSGEARPEALTTAGSLLAGYLTDQLGANPVLDTVSVELDDSDGTLDSRFEGGRYFGKDNSIYAAVAYIAGAEPDENSFEVSWQFILAQLRTSSVRLELRWGNRRTGAAELLYDLRLEKGAGFIRGSGVR